MTDVVKHWEIEAETKVRLHGGTSELYSCCDAAVAHIQNHQVLIKTKPEDGPEVSIKLSFDTLGDILGVMTALVENKYTKKTKAFKPKSTNMSLDDINSYLKVQTEDYDDMAAIDAKQRAKGEILGRFIYVPYADGKAVYQVTAHTPQTGTAVVTAIDIGDAWTTPAWGRRAKVDADTVAQMLDTKDRIAEIFRSQK